MQLGRHPLQQGHSKYKNVEHTSLKMQSYLNDHTMSPDDISLLFAIRKEQLEQ